MLVRCSFLVQSFQSAFKICTFTLVFSCFIYVIFNNDLSFYLFCTVFTDPLGSLGLFFLILETFDILFFKVRHFLFSFTLQLLLYVWYLLHLTYRYELYLSHLYLLSPLSVLRYISPDWPWTCFIFEDDLELLDLPAYISLVLRSHQTYFYEVLKIEIKVFLHARQVLPIDLCSHSSPSPLSTHPSLGYSFYLF